MRMINNLMINLLAAGSISVAGSGAVFAESPLDVCEADLEKYCSNVEPGNGRIMTCLYAHEDKISDDCDAATVDHSNVIDMIMGRIADTIGLCVPDIKKHCADEKFGDGEMLSCLHKNEDFLNEDCRKGVMFFANALNLE